MPGVFEYMGSSIKPTVVLFIVLFMAMVGCAARNGAGMSAAEAFSDPRVAELAAAAASRDFSKADKQLAAGADINFIGKEGISPLLWVMSASSFNQSGMEYMLKNGANPNYRVSQRNASAMYFAAGGQYPHMLVLMLKYGGDPNLVGEGDKAMLAVAADEYRKENIEILLKSGADINRLDKRGYSAAQQAVAGGHYDLVAYFLERGLTANLQFLAKGVEARVIDPDSDQQVWKNKVIEMLKARGAKFPAFDPKNPTAQP